MTLVVNPPELCSDEYSISVIHCVIVLCWSFIVQARERQNWVDHYRSLEFIEHFQSFSIQCDHFRLRSSEIAGKGVGDLGMVLCEPPVVTSQSQERSYFDVGTGRGFGDGPEIISTWLEHLGHRAICI